MKNNNVPITVFHINIREQTSGENPKDQIKITHFPKDAPENKNLIKKLNGRISDLNKKHKIEIKKEK